jgi:hypothetical protein
MPRRCRFDAGQDFPAVAILILLFSPAAAAAATTNQPPSAGTVVPRRPKIFLHFIVCLGRHFVFWTGARVKKQSSSKTCPCRMKRKERITSSVYVVARRPVFFSTDDQRKGSRTHAGCGGSKVVGLSMLLLHWIIETIDAAASFLAKDSSSANALREVQKCRRERPLHERSPLVVENDLLFDRVSATKTLPVCCWPNKNTSSARIWRWQQQTVPKGDRPSSVPRI